MTVHDAQAARRTLAGDSMRHLAEAGMRETVTTARRLSEANREIGRLRGQVEDLSRELALARIAGEGR